ncbi:hypothetical protein M3Y95_00518000 [Aphelenchoides besseyi]|nr:hypothetical protein M3Y95_00518000 [Aphelenchoides besseyi]
MNNLWIWFTLFISFTLNGTNGNLHECNVRKLVELEKEHNERYYVFALTQDCQLVFARADQIEQFSNLPDIRSDYTYCLPTLSQFHFRTLRQDGNIGIQLLFKRANNQVCSLTVQFPSSNALVGNVVFSYSLLNSLSYAVCSYMPNSSFSMEPELSFMDSTYSDIVYFIDPKSAGSFWQVRQFKFDPTGYMKVMESFVVKNFAEEAGFVSRVAGEHLVSLDAQRHRLYSVHKRDKEISSTCSYELLFKPHKARIHRQRPMRNDAEGRGYRINSLSVDGNLAIISQVQRTKQDGFRSKVYVSDNRHNHSAECILVLPYVAKFGIITEKSLKRLNQKRLPSFDTAMREKASQKPTSWTQTMKPKLTNLKSEASRKMTSFRTTSTTTTTQRPNDMEEERPLFTEQEMGNKVDEKPIEITSTESLIEAEESSESMVDETTSTEDQDVEEQRVDESTNEPLREEGSEENRGLTARVVSVALLGTLLLSFI